VVYYLIKKNVLTRDTLRTYAETTGSTWTYAPVEQYSIDNDELTLPNSLQDFTGNFQRPSAFLSEVQNAILFFDGSPALTQNKKAILETAENKHSILKHRIKSAIQDRGVMTVIAELYDTKPERPPWYDGRAVFPLIRHTSTNFYHWVAEYLPKLQAFEYYKQETNERPLLLIEANPPRWVTDSLRLMGYNIHKCVSLDHTPALIPRLLVPLHRSRTPGTPDGPSPSECEFVRSAVANLSSGFDYNFSSRIFVSRQLADDRRIDNYDELHQILTEFGFESYILEQMRLLDQIRLFQQAEFVIAPHGAGLVHLLFGDNLSVIELFPEHEIRHHYYTIAQMLGFEYEYVISERTGADLVVSPPEIRDAIERLL
jgi:hypothetical protein